MGDFNAKRACVRLRPKEQQLARRLQQALRQADTVNAVLSAGDELGGVNQVVAIQALNKLFQRFKRKRGSSPSSADLDAAQQRIVQMLPTICYHSCGSASEPLLPALLRLYRIVSKLDIEPNENPREGDVAHTRTEVLKCFAHMVTDRLVFLEAEAEKQEKCDQKSAKSEITYEMLTDLLSIT